jgi:hypothetical protein
MRRILDASAESLIPFVKDALEPGSTVQTEQFGILISGGCGVRS